MPTLEQFIRFLKDNDIFKQYVINLKKQRPEYVNECGFTQDFLDMLYTRGNSIIDSSLDWSETLEGFDF